MNPYGSTPSWRCKDKFRPSPAAGHVQGCNIPTLLRLDSTGEITSDNIPSEFERNKCSFQNMGTLIGSALMKFGSKTAGANIKSSNNSHCFIDDQITSEMNCLNKMMPSRSYPDQPMWGRKSDIPPCVAPHMAKRQEFLSSLTPLFQSSAQHHEYKFHPAMAGTHNVNKKYNRYRNSHPNGTNAKNGHNSTPRPQKCDNTAPMRPCKKESELSGKTNASDLKLQQAEVPAACKKNVGVEKQSHHVSSASKDSNIHVLASTANDSLKSSLNTCDIMKAAFQIKDIFVKDEVEETKEKDDVPLDWFDGGYDSLPKEISDKISDSTDFVCHVSEPLTKLPHELTDKKANANNGLQRECSVISDIFDDNAVSVISCYIQDESENQSSEKDHEQSPKLNCDKSGVDTKSHIATTISVTCVLQDANNVLVNSSPVCNNTYVTNSNRASSSVDSAREDANSAKKTSNEESANAKTDHSFVLFVRDNSKKCRPSSKKRRQAKARKDKKESSNRKKHVDGKESVQETSKTVESAEKSPCNKVAFILGFDPSSCIPDHSRSFIMEFDDSDSDFSEGSLDDDEDDEVDGLDEFHNPMDLNVICSIKDSSKDSEFESADIAEINRSWRINVTVTPQKSASKKSDKKVHFAEKDLCTVHPMIAWSYAYQAARKGPWEEYARDTERFKRRISDSEKLLAPVFDVERRERVYAKLNET